MDINPTQFDMLSKLADVASVRQRVISSNVSNVNTPGYKRLVVKFEDVLSTELKKDSAGTHSKVKDMQPRLYHELAGGLRVDGNNVNIDAEMGRMNKNSMLYNTYMQVLASKLATMRRATGR